MALLALFHPRWFLNIHVPRTVYGTRPTAVRTGNMKDTIGPVTPYN
jgi:hypothetical protein